ncbi:MAG: hypothetical protein COA44_12185 [Arcobacter sp.]|nr:MAG: hypothetical protein COA44_12185 [Arcobacter sp.]
MYGKSILPRIKSQNYVLSEDALEGTLLGRVEILDEGESPIESLSLSGDGSENFLINDSGELRVTSIGSFDFETKKAFRLEVVASNAQGKSRTGLNVFIRDVVDAPFILSFEGGSIFSNAAPSSYVAQIRFEQGSSAITEMSLEGNGNQYFTIALDGSIYISALGLSEILKTTSFPLSIKAKNDSGYSTPVSITLYVQKISAVPSLKKFTGYIDENSVSGTFVGKVEFNAGTSAVNAFVLEGEDVEKFSINLLGEIVLKAGAVIDYEAKTSYALSLSARNEQGTSLSTSVLIIVNNLDDVPILKIDQEFNVNEDVSSGTLIGNILASSGLSPIVSISSSDNKFRIDNTGNLYLKDDAQLDYESRTTHFITAIAQNSYGYSLLEGITVLVGDVVDVAVLTPLVTNVPENSLGGTVVGTISFTQGTSPISNMQLIPVNNPFSVDLEGVIRVKENAVLDYEAISSYILSAFASNASGDSSAVSIAISIGNILDAPELKNMSYTLDENTKGLMLPFNILSNEGLSPVTNIVIYKENGNISTNLHADNNGTVSVLASADLDYENKQTYTFSAVAYNLEGPSRASSILLNLLNVLDAPEIESFSAFVDENATIAMVVGRLSFNEGLSPVISMQLSSHGRYRTIPFSIDSNGTIRVKSQLNYELIASYSLFVTARNNEGTSLEARVEINLNDVLDQPILQNLTAKVNEDIYPSEVVGQILYRDGLDPITSMVLSGEGSENFVIDKEGVIRLQDNVQLDYETKTSYSFFAQAFSPGYNSNIVDINIVVDDVDENVRAGVGVWANANVNIYKLDTNGSKTLLFTETTTSIGAYEETGRFYSHRLELDKDSFYLYEVSGGEEYDVNKDGIIDVSPTPNAGRLHAIVKGEWVRKLNAQMSINLMSDVFYQWNKEEVESSAFVSLENNLKTGYNPIALLTGVQSLTYNPLTQLNQWKPWEFNVNALNYMADFLYENNPKYALYTKNSFYYDYYDNFGKKSFFGKINNYLYDAGKYSEGVRIFEIGGGMNEPIASFSSIVQEIVLSEDNQWLAASRNLGEGDYQLSIFDMSNPLFPDEVSSIYTFADGIKFSPSSNRLYLRNSSSLDIIDTSNKNIFNETGLSISTHGKIEDIAFSDDANLMYIANSNAGLQIVDLSNNQLLGNYMTDGLVTAIILSSDKTKAIISVNTDTNASLHVVNITDKTNPTLYKLFSLPSHTYFFEKSSNEIDLYTGENGVRVYENINAQYTEFLERASITKGVDFSIIGDVRSIYIIDNELKILVITEYQALLFDVSDKSNPVFLEEIEL